MTPCVTDRDGLGAGPGVDSESARPRAAGVGPGPGPAARGSSRSRLPSESLSVTEPARRVSEAGDLHDGTARGKSVTVSEFRADPRPDLPQRQWASRTRAAACGCSRDAAAGGGPATRRTAPGPAPGRAPDRQAGMTASQTPAVPRYAA
jgi:hypothetical protein